MKKMMLNKLKEICKHFHINNLSYCILRMPPDKSDKEFEFEVDILIKEERSIHNLLIAQGFQYSQDDVLSHHHYTKGKLHLDLVVCLCYGKKREHFAGLGHDVLERAIFHDDMYFANNMDEFTMLVLRCLFDKRDFIKRSPRIFELIDIIGEKKCLTRISNIFHLP